MSDWHVPGLLQLCRQRAVVKHHVICPLWEISHPEKYHTQAPKELEGGLTVHRLGTEHAHWINSNWKFRDDYSLHWIEKQCQSGFAFGVSHDGQLISWIVAYM